MKNIVLIGFMGAGKSSVGKALAKELNLEFRDIDRLIVERENLSIPEIFESFGEAGFRDIEQQVIEGLAAKTGLLIATGGGVVLREVNISNLKQNGFVIYLKADPDTIYSRVKYSKNRPLLAVADPRAKIRELYSQRAGLYENAADLIVKTDKRPKGRVIEEILGWLERQDLELV